MCPHIINDLQLKAFLYTKMSEKWHIIYVYKSHNVEQTIYQLAYNVLPWKFLHWAHTECQSPWDGGRRCWMVQQGMDRSEHLQHSSKLGWVLTSFCQRGITIYNTKNTSQNTICQNQPCQTTTRLCDWHFVDRLLKCLSHALNMYTAMCMKCWHLVYSSTK